jgi:choline dehydrogenase-like flavoprotein
MIQFTPKQIQLLTSIADTFVPALGRTDDAFSAFKGSQFVTPERVAELINKQGEGQKKEFLQLLRLMGSPLLGMTWSGPYRSFEKLNETERESLLQAWAISKKLTFRKAYLTLKKLCLFLAYSEDGMGKEAHPAFSAIAYPIKPEFDHPVEKSKLPVYDNHSIPDTLHTQVLVIGSGAGGGVIAHELTQAGMEVLVVEKGTYLAPEDMNFKEGEMARQLYEQGAAMATKDGSVALLAGSTVGGGTTVNWAGAFRTPDYIREEWANRHGNLFFANQSYSKSLDAIEKAMGVSTAYDVHNPQNAALFKGSDLLGDEVKRIPRNDTNAEGDQRRFGFSCLGDRFGDKRGSSKAFLQQATSMGAKIMTGTLVKKLLIEKGRVIGALADHTMKDGSRKEIVIHAERVFVCAGAIHSPALLIRSGLTHKHLGLHLHLHPTVAVSAWYPHKMEPWFGPMMSAVNDSHTQIEGGFGFKLETPPAHPGQIAMSMPWASGPEHKTMMLKAANIGNFIVLTRDKYSGKIILDRQGRPLVHYTIHPFDLNHLLQGMERSAEIHFEAGATTVYFPHNLLSEVSSKKDIVKVLQSRKWLPSAYMLYSAHQMGTCRMGGAEKKYPVKPNGETYEVKNLYVADASTFPSASGANPMLSIMAIAHHVAHELVG